MVANHNTYGARSAIREVAKVFGLTECGDQPGDRQDRLWLAPEKGLEGTGPSSRR